MCQIWVQWSHFWRLLVSVDFDDVSNTKVWSVDHIIIVVFIIGCARGSAEKWSSYDTFHMFRYIFCTRPTSYIGGVNER